MCISGSKYQEQHNYAGRLCDCLIFWQARERGVSARVVELKGGRVRTREALEQLQAGARLAEELLAGVADVDFGAILAQRRRSTLDTRLLRERRITFRGDMRLARVVSCGTRLA